VGEKYKQEKYDGGQNDENGGWTAWLNVLEAQIQIPEAARQFDEEALRQNPPSTSHHQHGFNLDLPVKKRKRKRKPSRAWITAAEVKKET